jgi:hypothetical protein
VQNGFGNRPLSDLERRRDLAVCDYQERLERNRKSIAINVVHMQVGIVVVVFVGVTAGAPYSVTQVPVTDRVIASAQVESPMTLHEPVIARISFENRSPENVQIDLGGDRKTAFVLLVGTPAGRTVTASYRWDSSVIDIAAALGTVKLPPGQKHTDYLLLNEWYDFDHVGRYNVTIRLSTGIQPSRGDGVIALPSLEVEIQPRNESALRTRCQELTNTARGTAGIIQRADAALALSHIDDPIAVPYLDAILAETRTFDPIIIRGLLRIATTEARNTLMQAEQSDGAERAALVRDALKRFVLKP